MFRRKYIEYPIAICGAGLIAILLGMVIFEIAIMGIIVVIVAFYLVCF